MTTFHLTSFLAALVAGIVLPLSFEAAAALLFAAGVMVIFLHDYTRSRTVVPRPVAPVRVPPSRALFRPVPLVVTPQARGVEIRPITLRPREGNRLAA